MELELNKKIEAFRSLSMERKQDMYAQLLTGRPFFLDSFFSLYDFITKFVHLPIFLDILLLSMSLFKFF
jgi:hypothetical protein